MKAGKPGTAGRPEKSPAPAAPGAPDFAVARHFRYLPQLDGIRALAVGAVVAQHAELSVARGGGVGVDVFFVLSGYLITTLLLQEFDRHGTISMRNFYARRARRLLPALFAVAAISLVAFSIVRPYLTHDTLVGILASVLYVSCWFRAFGVSELGWFGHTWSLSVEEHFYLLWPPLLLLILRKGLSNLRRWVLLALGVAVAYRVGSSVFLHAGGARMNGPDMRADQLLTGCALAVLFLDIGRPSEHGDGPAPPWWDRWLTVAVALSILDLARIVVFPYALGLTFAKDASPEFVALESAIIVTYVVRRAASPLTRFLSHRSLVWLGRRSYAIYLWHVPLFGLFGLKGHPTSERLAGRAAACVLTLVAAWASFRWIESPFYRRRVEQPATADDGAPPPEEPPPLAAPTATGDRAGDLAG
jgi:peptidoglycan/LPS O-acetylase OafA/YrhL